MLTAGISIIKQDAVRFETPAPGFAKVRRNQPCELVAGESARLNTRATSGGRVISDEFETGPALVSAGDYQAMGKMESALDRKSSRVFLLKQE